MSKIIAVVNQKGGVGKTTSCINLAASMTFFKQKILLIDLDPQANATTGSLFQKKTSPNIAQILLGEITLEEGLITTPGGYSLIPGTLDLIRAEIRLLQEKHREYTLKKKLAKRSDHYDYILIDCPPSLNTLTINALVAAQAIIIPVQCEYFALEGLSNLTGTVQSLRDTANPTLQIHGVLRTFDAHNSLARQISKELKFHFKDKTYDTLIPRNIRLAEASSHGLPALLYDPCSSGSQAYLNLAREILIRDGHKVPTVESLSTFNKKPTRHKKTSLSTQVPS